jgi:NTP pyrophosphatase (non-canonical NTP hydrolase)
LLPQETQELWDPTKDKKNPATQAEVTVAEVAELAAELEAPVVNEVAAQVVEYGRATKYPALQTVEI